MKEELKPCPFCGSDRIDLIKTGNAYTKRRGITIKCKNCICVRKTFVLKYSIEWAREKAIELWNTRTLEQQRDELVDVLKWVVYDGGVEGANITTRDIKELIQRITGQSWEELKEGREKWNYIE